MISPFNLLMTKQKQPIIYNQLQVEGTKMPWMLPQTNGGPSNQLGQRCYIYIHKRANCQHVWAPNGDPLLRN